MSEDFMRVELDSLKLASAELRGTVELIESINARIEGMSDKHDGYWQGISSEAFKDRYKKITKKTDEAIKELKRIYQRLDAAIATYERTENSNIQSVNSLTASDIFSN